MSGQNVGEINGGSAPIEDTYINVSISGFHEDEDHDTAYDVKYFELDHNEGNRWVVSYWFDDGFDEAVETQCEAPGGGTFDPSAEMVGFWHRFEFPSGSEFTYEKYEPDQGEIDTGSTIEKNLEVMFGGTLSLGPLALTVSPLGDYVAPDDYESIEWDIGHDSNELGWPDSQNKATGVTTDIVTQLSAGNHGTITSKSTAMIRYYCTGGYNYVESGEINCDCFVDVVPHSDT